jgi:hypothetical protein
LAGLHANDGVDVLIEGIRAVEDVDSDGILLDMVALASEGFFAEIGEQVSGRRTNKERRLKHGLQRGSFVLERWRFCQGWRHVRLPTSLLFLYVWMRGMYVMVGR